MHGLTAQHAPFSAATTARLSMICCFFSQFTRNSEPLCQSGDCSGNSTMDHQSPRICLNTVGSFLWRRCRCRPAPWRQCRRPHQTGELGSARPARLSRSPVRRAVKTPRSAAAAPARASVRTSSRRRSLDTTAGQGEFNAEGRA